MQSIHNLVGRELPADDVNRTLRNFAKTFRTQEVGAVHVTCSDESEREVAESFQHGFADALLPDLKSSARSPFRSANLGARYEWGAVRIAEDHYATPAAREGVKLMLIKLNSHVGALESGGRTSYGQMERYGCDSACCGALNALLGGTRHPAMDELTASFNYDGIRRLDLLRDPETVDPELRGLFAAIVNARIQARSAIVDIQDYQPASPTIFVVLPCVTLNRKQRDTELPLGVYWSDSREGTEKATYLGLGDDPRAYQLTPNRGFLQVQDSNVNQSRAARNHRQEVLEQWQARRIESDTTTDPRIDEIVKRSKESSDYNATMTRETLKAMLWLAADVSPIPVSVMLFAKGMVGVHRLYSVHQLARGAGDADQARDIIEEVGDQMAQMSTTQAQHAVDALVDHYHRPNQ